ARAAEVSVNTVYTYFPSKEDLVFYPREVSDQRLVRMVADRPPGVPAAAAVLTALRTELRHGDRFGHFLEMVRAEPTLSARLDALSRRMVDELAAYLATDSPTEADPDSLPHLIAAQLGWVQDQLFHTLAALTRTGRPPTAITEAGLALLDTVESLLGERVLSYAPR
ncbi:MAG: hypothetical protein QOF98_1905, partial [Streptomyces sp.]|nr:hypothetical protein [Streptomyces sp.]